MKIVYICARFLPYYGGAEQHCYQVAKRAALQNDVYVITTNKDSAGNLLPATETIDGIKVIRLNNIIGDQLLAGIYPQLYSTINSIKPQVIHIMNGAGFLFRDLVLTFYKLNHRNVKLVTTPHGEFMPTNNTHTGLKRYLAMFVKVIATPYLILWWSKLWHIVFQVNPNQVRWLKNYGVKENKIELMPNCIEQSYIEKSMPEKSTNPVVITYVGRIAKYKGLQNLLAALSKVENQNFVLKIMGKMEFLELLDLVIKYNLQTKVEFIYNPSNLDRDEILIKESLINVLPSSYEATGIVLLEAMAKGNTVITTKQNEGASMFITNSENGYIYDYSDVNELTSILQNLLSNPKLITQQAQRNLEVIQNFTWEKVVPNYLYKINSLVNSINN